MKTIAIAALAVVCCGCSYVHMMKPSHVGSKMSHEWQIQEGEKHIQKPRVEVTLDWNLNDR